jgi:hypothetical protein
MGRDAVSFVERMLCNVGTTQRTTGRHVPDDSNPQPHRCEDPSTRSSVTHFQASHLPPIKVETSGHKSSQPSDISSLTTVCQHEVKTQL